MQPAVQPKITARRQPKLITSHADVGENSEGLYIKETQEIPDELLDHTRHLRDESLHDRGEFQQFAAIPVIIVDKWKREGFDIFDQNITGRDITRKLQAEGLDGFLTTKKQLF